MWLNSIDTILFEIKEFFIVYITFKKIYDTKITYLKADLLIVNLSTNIHS